MVGSGVCLNKKKRKEKKKKQDALTLFEDFASITLYQKVIRRPIATDGAKDLCVHVRITWLKEVLIGEDVVFFTNALANTLGGLECRAEMIVKKLH